MSSATIELEPHQREKAEELLDKLSEGKITRPEDVVDGWKPLREYVDYSRLGVVDDGGEGFSRRSSFVPVCDIVGTSGRGIEVMEHCFENVLNWLLEGEFQVRYGKPPVLEKFEGEYFVSVDGHHRVLAFKALGIEEMFVEFVEVELE